jgi:hypothetical protein
VNQNQEPNDMNTRMRRIPLLMPLCATLACLLVVTAAADEAQPERVSLKDYEWARQADWIGDFDYERIETRSQRKQCIAYTMEMKVRHVERLRERNLPHLRPTLSANDDWIIGMSAGWQEDPEIPSQPLFGYVIADPDVEKPQLRVVLNGGNHPNEHPACWVLHALIEFLVSDDPRAQELRRQAVFYVYPTVNPDGKWYLHSREHGRIMTGRSNPELFAVDAKDHNRVWNTTGKFTTIDLVKQAMLHDTGGQPDYLLDFHGIPRVSYVYALKRSRYALALATTEGGINLRPRTPHPGMLRAWAEHPDGLGAAHAFTPEIASMSKEELFQQGKLFALAFHNLVTNNVPETLEREHPDIDPVPPPSPVAGWTFAGNLQSTFGGLPDGTGHDVEFADETRFDEADNRSLRLNGKSSYVDLGQVERLNLSREMTVAAWVKGEARSSATTYLIGRYSPAGDQRGWTLAQHPRTGEMIVTLSSDGSHDGSRIKRFVSALWPRTDVFDGHWRHVAFTFQTGDGADGRVRLFVDGTELKLGDGAHAFDNAPIHGLHVPDAPLTIGARSDAKRFFDGLLDEVAVWDVPLSAEEIRWLSRNSVRELASAPARPVPSAPELPDVAGLRLHLDASDEESLERTESGSVVGWKHSRDRSILFAPPGRPPLRVVDAANGRPAVRFGDAVTLVPNSAALSLTNDVDGLTVFLVGRSFSEGSPTSLRIGTGSSFSRLRFMLGRRQGKHRMLARRLDEDDFQQLAGGEHRPGVWSIETALIDFADGKASLSVNGAEVAASDTFLTPGRTSPADSLMFRIGNDHDNGFWRGDLAELLIFDRALTHAERESIESYLSRKYIVP